VHPSYQRQGIGQRLLDWGVETAERENVVSWLFARPAGSRLYERNGWRPIQTTDVDVPEDDEDLHVAPIVSMLRVPRGRG
jgi:GNAT superfamily N-acetyltransferase